MFCNTVWDRLTQLLYSQFELTSMNAIIKPHIKNPSSGTPRVSTFNSSRASMHDHIVVGLQTMHHV